MKTKELLTGQKCWHWSILSCYYYNFPHYKCISLLSNHATGLFYYKYLYLRIHRIVLKHVYHPQQNHQISCKILRRRFFLKSYHHMAMYIIFEFRNNGNRSLQTHVLQKNKMLRHNTINSWSTCSSFTYEVFSSRCIIFFTIKWLGKNVNISSQTTDISKHMCSYNVWFFVDLSMMHCLKLIYSYVQFPPPWFTTIFKMWVLKKWYMCSLNG